VIDGVFLGYRDTDKAEPAVILQGHDEDSAKPLRVVAESMPNQKDAFANLSRGQRIKIRGEARGKHGNDVTVAFAVLVEKKPDGCDKRR
jgi:hypothetical protein